MMLRSPVLRRWAIAIGAIALVCVVSLLLLVRWADSMPIGTGETRSSPDGRFSASVQDYHSRHFITGEDRRWFEFRVTGPGVAFAMTSTPLPAPYFGSRSSHSVIRWELDSSAVTFVFSTSQLRIETKASGGTPP